MKVDGERFGTNLRVEMAKLNLTTTKLYELTGISRNTITYCRYGRVKALRSSTIKKLCKALNCTPNDLFK
ncbi:helix-turn-helix domain-containing protein [Liquorilactobacillus mali]|uniref:HTH cro/C1-type domain-containing protein n=1 Tax=Liquorilactobacillus mali KCTC 3596 = DSM 20444 TaxID=1046596 RepID=J0L8D6_9LACO|nr:helix-turn-helix transcriptional regulator [Liquorilactobacillus mali]EJE99193.1 XRE family transcriptional regulator [Liquorilactobacillus mali KCTC 3596 = DSM 20444]EJF02147.1 XRE family transcriptional regulator [Liquorilactobacillus mali KCTC 3596 = DSM 20444]KRN01629.1 hypothetical protein FD00_GL000645 [Liquorilactobacillus mali KCTC 3596 = DSM 20444]MDV7758230.1 helix-turn-helix domain-containing protein [Liquorilactobacillus mali]QFQ74546.1 helix-turn-helix transcriptional regulator